MFIDSGIIGAVGSTISLFGTLYLGVYRVAKMEVKIDTLWEFIMSRGTLEALAKGLATKNSPVKVNPDVEASIGEFATELKVFYKTKARKARLSDAQLAFEIQKKYADKIIEKFCIPYNINEGACLALAVQIAKSDPTKSSVN